MYVVILAMHVILAVHFRAYGARSHIAPTALDLLPPASSEFLWRAEREPAARSAYANPHDHPGSITMPHI